jgi:hypothetical protein
MEKANRIKTNITNLTRKAVLNEDILFPPFCKYKGEKKYTIIETNTKTHTRRVIEVYDCRYNKEDCIYKNKNECVMEYTEE